MILAVAACFFFVIVIRLKHFLISAQVFPLPHYVLFLVLLYFI